MFSHLRAIAIINLVRAALGISFAIYLFYSSVETHLPAYRHPSEAELAAFFWFGLFLLIHSVLRGTQAILSLRELRIARRRRGSGGRFPWSLRLGSILAWIDVVDLTVFPVTTACGLYGLLVYRHPDIVDFFSGRLKVVEPLRA